MKKVLSLAFVLLVPLGWSPLPWNIQWSDLVFVALLICWVATRSYRGLRFNRLDLAVLLYGIGSIVSFLWTPNRWEGGLELAKRLYLVVVYFVFSDLTRQEVERDRLIVGSCLCAIFLSALSLLVGIGSWFGFEPSWLGARASLPYLGEVFRVRVTFYTEELFTNYLTWALPFIVGIACRTVGKPVRAWWALGAGITALGALFTVAHSMIGLFGAGIFSFWRHLQQGALRLLRVPALSLFVILLLVGNALLVVSIRDVEVTLDRNVSLEPPGYVYGFQDPQRGAERFTLQVSTNWMSYFLLKKVAWEAFLKEPLTGTGLEGFPELSFQAHREGKVHPPLQRADPHSTLLGTLAETGILGGIPLVLLWAGFLWVGWRNRSEWVGRAATAGLLGLAVNSINVDVMNFRFLWLGFALVRGILPRFPS